MRIISRYLFLEFLKVLFLTVLAFTLIFFLVDFMERIDNFIGADIPAGEVAYFFLTFIPTVVYHLIPVAVLVSIMISIGLLARHSEIVAFKAGGVSLFRLSLPIVLASILISVLSFVLQDTLIPKTAAQANAIWVKVETEKVGREAKSIRRNVWYRAKSGVYHLAAYDGDNRTISGLTVYGFNPAFRLVRRIEARSAKNVDGRWVMSDGLVKSYLPGGGITLERFNAADIDLPTVPEEYTQENRPSEELDTTDLIRWIDRMETEGYDPIRYVVDLHFKFSFPFICTIVALIGLPIAFWKERGGGIALGIGLGLGLAFVYLVFLGLSRSMGYSGLLPPIVSAWLPNLVFTLLGFYLFSHMRQ